ncbi:MAG: hypothetical protein K9L17_09115 [Clostridiales bacterium]|nr:hypothetical protein [Clostridiales bacterium]MCF8022837.1 hypothetical protein [Clostridiales bacterium]
MFNEKKNFCQEEVEDENSAVQEELEAPDFAETSSTQEDVEVEVEEAPVDAKFKPWGSENCTGEACNCSECCDLFNRSRNLCSPAVTNFGVLPGQVPFISCTCHDICVQESVLFCTATIPPFSFEFGSSMACRVPSCAGPIISCTPRIIAANEVLCTSTCDQVNLCVEYMLEVDISGNAAPTCITAPPVTATCTEFFPFPSGPAISGSELAQAMQEIEGSCLVAQIECEISGNTVMASGNLVDKLWKHENLWVTALRPYKGTTVKKEFPEQVLPTCTTPTCPS